MRIGIVTFWWTNNNYGQILQCYALQNYLKAQGHDVYLIRYNSENEIKQHYFLYNFTKIVNPKKLLNFSKKIVDKILLKLTKTNTNRNFEKFRKSYISHSEIIYNSFAELQSNPPEADLYIVGSDQVWNPGCLGIGNGKNNIHNNVINAYFLNFGTAKKMSYAASFSKSKLPESYKNKIIPLLKDFEYISVREKEGVEICSDCNRPDAQWVCDPTMLLEAENYRDLYREDKSIRIQTKKYILAYILNNNFKFNTNKIFEFAKEKNLEVVYITANGKWDKHPQFNASVTEWLYLIDNAEYVITNSFHGGVFSTLFNKKYGIISLSGDYSSMNKRFDSLFEKSNIDPRYIQENDFSVLEKKYNPVINRESDFLSHINRINKMVK